MRSSTDMEVLTAKAIRRSTRIRVEIPVSIISLDRQRPFGDRCLLLVVSAQGCGFRSSEELQVGTPIMISNLPDGGSVTAHVVNCVPMGSDGKYFLVGASLYTHGNVWGIANPPEDWNLAAKNDPSAQQVAAPPARGKNAAGPATAGAQKKAWPYNLFAEGAEAPLGRK
ncbi:MAG TPA: PilZ domain-containing protein [Candidatus Sulfotelmatobacter sp.]|nr:PilZ domain-containing protein [Candidatus Sulfotelmatobacter sp.]